MRGEKSCTTLILKANMILLGLLMLIPGLLKLFSYKPSGVSGMLAGFGFPVPMLFAWILIIGEIGSGIAILARWKVDKVVWIPVVIMIVAAFAANWEEWPSLLLHLAVASNYLMYSNCCKLM